MIKEELEQTLLQYTQSITNEKLFMLIEYIDGKDNDYLKPNDRLFLNKCLSDIGIDKEYILFKDNLYGYKELTLLLTVNNILKNILLKRLINHNDIL